LQSENQIRNQTMMYQIARHLMTRASARTSTRVTMNALPWKQPSYCTQRRWSSSSSSSPPPPPADLETQAIPKKVSQSDLQIVVNSKLARAPNAAALLEALSTAEDSEKKREEIAREFQF
jgi:hypothetical protein